MQRILHLIPMPFVLAVVSCSQPNVIELDAVGMGIENASVHPISLSVNGTPEPTDQDGEVHVAEGGLQQPKWIRVTKAG